MTEYWLQKKTIGGWSHVTSYHDEAQAKRNFASCVGNGMSGYCWRLVEVKEIEASMLNDVVPIMHDTDSGWIKTIEPKPDSSGWGAFRPADILVQDAPKSAEQPTRRPWGQNSTSINPSPAILNPEASEHGLSGSVWVVHHGFKKKLRVNQETAKQLLAGGEWKRGGPRTQFE